MNTATFQERLTKGRAKKNEIFAQRRAIWVKAQQDAQAAHDAAPTAEAKALLQKKIDVAAANLARFDEGAKKITDLAKAIEQKNKARIDAKNERAAKLRAEIEANIEKRNELVQVQEGKAIREVFVRAPKPPVEPPAPPAEEEAAPLEPPAPPAEEEAPVEPPAPPAEEPVV